MASHASEEKSDGQTQQRLQGFKYGAYQMEIYAAGMLQGVFPTLTKDPNKLEAQAKSSMSATSYAYVAGGAGERSTMEANRLAFRQWKIIPRMLRATTTRDLRVTLFGEEFPSPVFCAPVGVQSIFHPDGETGVAEVAASVGVPYITSTASSFSLEDIAKANDNGVSEGKRAQRWFQLYWPHTKAITESLLKRAKASGYTALVVTLDTWSLGWRPWDLDLAYLPFVKGIGVQNGLSDPAFRDLYTSETGLRVEENIIKSSSAWASDVLSGAARTWEELTHLREHWDGPILLKGIQHPDDAIKAHESGMDGIVVSNHGGRQVDGAIASLEVLPEIVEAVRGKKVLGRQGCNDNFVVCFDSGIRTGADIVKALSLGAQAVFVGRPWVYGLGIGGKKGAGEVLKALLGDFDQTMALAGLRSIADCNSTAIRKISYPGDRFTSS